VWGGNADEMDHALAGETDVAVQSEVEWLTGDGMKAVLVDATGKVCSAHCLTCVGNSCFNCPIILLTYLCAGMLMLQDASKLKVWHWLRS